MSFADRCHQNCAPVRALNHFQESLLYPLALIPLCILSSVSGKSVSLALLSLLCLSALYSCLFARDLRVFVPPLFMGFYAMGSESNEHMAGGPNALEKDIDTKIFLVLALLLAIALIVRFSLDGTFTRVFRRQGAFLYGILAMDAVFICNGLFYSNHVTENLIYGFTMVFGFTFCYFVFFAMADHASENGTTDNLITYTCTATLCASFVVFIQLVILLYQNDLFTLNEQGLTIDRGYMRLSWGGYATNIAGVITLGIPAAMLLAAKHRRAWFCYPLAIVLYIGAALTGTRSAIIAGGIVLLVCVVLVCVKGPCRRTMRYITLTVGVLSLGGLFAAARFFSSFYRFVHAIFTFFRLDFLIDGTPFSDWFSGKQDTLSSRFDLLQQGWKDFLQAPLFGVGFVPQNAEASDMSRGVLGAMHHNVFIEFLSSMGLAGILAFVWHMTDFLRTMLRRSNIEKLLLFATPVLILFSSLADNYFFILNFQIIYCAHLALAEFCPSRQKQK